MKGKLKLKTTRHMKKWHLRCNSLSNYPSQCLRVFGHKPSVTEKVCHLMRNRILGTGICFKTKEPLCHL